MALLEGNGQRGEAILNEGRQGREEKVRELVTSGSQEILRLGMLSKSHYNIYHLNTLIFI